jgi:hypothetical protein
MLSVTKSKYKSVRIQVDWIRFDSKLESNFYLRMKKSPDINILDRQVRFVLQDKFRTKEWEAIRAIEYITDFKIEVHWDIYYLDSKWNQDSVFKIKHKMWKKRYGDENILIVCKSIKELCSILDIPYIKW